MRLEKAGQSTARQIMLKIREETNGELTAEEGKYLKKKLASTVVGRSTEAEVDRELMINFRDKTHQDGEEVGKKTKQGQRRRDREETRTERRIKKRRKAKEAPLRQGHQTYLIHQLLKILLHKLFF